MNSSLSPAALEEAEANRILSSLCRDFKARCTEKAMQFLKTPKFFHHTDEPTSLAQDTPNSLRVQHSLSSRDSPRPSSLHYSKNNEIEGVIFEEIESIRLLDNSKEKEDAMKLLDASFNAIRISDSRQSSPEKIGNQPNSNNDIVDYSLYSKSENPQNIPLQDLTPNYQFNKDSTYSLPKRENSKPIYSQQNDLDDHYSNPSSRSTNKRTNANNNYEPQINSFPVDLNRTEAEATLWRMQNNKFEISIPTTNSIQPLQKRTILSKTSKVNDKENKEDYPKRTGFKHSSNINYNLQNTAYDYRLLQSQTQPIKIDQSSSYSVQTEPDKSTRDEGIDENILKSLSHKYNNRISTEQSKQFKEADMKTTPKKSNSKPIYASSTVSKSKLQSNIPTTTSQKKPPNSQLIQNTEQTPEHQLAQPQPIPQSRCSAYQMLQIIKSQRPSVSSLRQYSHQPSKAKSTQPQQPSLPSKTRANIPAVVSAQPNQHQHESSTTLIRTRATTISEIGFGDEPLHSNSLQKQQPGISTGNLRQIVKRGKSVSSSKELTKNAELQPPSQVPKANRPRGSTLSNIQVIPVKKEILIDSQLFCGIFQQDNKKSEIEAKKHEIEVLQQLIHTYDENESKMSTRVDEMSQNHFLGQKQKLSQQQSSRLLSKQKQQTASNQTTSRLLASVSSTQRASSTQQALSKPSSRQIASSILPPHAISSADLAMNQERKNEVYIDTNRSNEFNKVSNLDGSISFCANTTEALQGIHTETSENRGVPEIIQELNADQVYLQAVALFTSCYYASKQAAARQTTSISDNQELSFEANNQTFFS